MWYVMMEGNMKSFGAILRCVWSISMHICALLRNTQFVTLRENLADSFPLPPKHTLTTSFIPLAWVENELIEERKRGLQLYLAYLIHDTHLRLNPHVLFFLGAHDLVTSISICVLSSLACMSEPQKALKGSPAPNTIARCNEPDTVKKPVAAAYYASWASDTNPPHTIDFSKFDILFFGACTT